MLVQKKNLINYKTNYIMSKVYSQTSNNIYTLDRYKQNLTIRGNEVWSYNTHVAMIAGDKLLQLGYWSMTTQKHINYVADQLDLDLIK
tara:strand:- start:1186 stop:1449 length:264 start_codon:yes stop_codon:yes gene_type:complete